MFLLLFAVWRVWRRIHQVSLEIYACSYLSTVHIDQQIWWFTRAGLISSLKTLESFFNCGWYCLQYITLVYKFGLVWNVPLSSVSIEACVYSDLSLLKYGIFLPLIGSRLSREKLKLNFQGGIEKKKLNLAGLATRQPTPLQSNM